MFAQPEIMIATFFKFQTCDNNSSAFDGGRVGYNGSLWSCCKRENEENDKKSPTRNGSWEIQKFALWKDIGHGLQ